jgi:HPt (histidine-containing phosphotransfer) domain-containing protein
MTHTSQDISPLRQRMIDDMRMRKLAPKTQAGYVRVVRQFTAFLGRPPDTATVEDLRRYQLHLVDHGISPVSLNAAIGDVDSHRMTLRIEQGKGRRDRYAMLSPVLLERLRVWWRVKSANLHDLDEAARALASGDFRRLCELAHRMKGAALVIGAASFSDACLTLQRACGTQAGRGHDVVAIRTAYTRFHDEAIALDKALEQRLASMLNSA